MIADPEEDAKLFRRWDRRGRSGPGVGNVTVKRISKVDRPWKNEELMKLECRRCVQRACREREEGNKATTGVGRDGFHSSVPLDLTEKLCGEVVEFIEKVGQMWELATASVREADRVTSDLGSVVGVVESSCCERVEVEERSELGCET